MINYATYVRVSIEVMIFAREEQLSGADGARKHELKREIFLLEDGFRKMVEIASALPAFPDALHPEIFPKRSFQGDIYLRVRPNDTGQALFFLDLLAAHPLGHREGDLTLMPWQPAGDLHRVFPYSVSARVTVPVQCRLTWTHEYEPGKFVGLRMNALGFINRTGRVIDSKSC